MSSAAIKLIGTLYNLSSYLVPKRTNSGAFKLFSTPRKGKLTAHQEIFLNTAKQKALQFNGLYIQTYQWEGTGDTILLAHGWESNSFRWKQLIERLRTLNYNVIAMDAPAHGKSGSSTFDAILYGEFINEVALFFKPKILIGHSVGGMSSVFFQYKYKSPLLKKLVLLGSPSEFKTIFKTYTNLLGYNKRIQNGLNALVLERFGKEPAYFSSAEFVKTIQTEGLIIHDKEDKIVNYSEAKLIASNYKNSEFITTTGFGHGLKDKSINDKIVSFINNKDS